MNLWGSSLTSPLQTAFFDNAAISANGGNIEPYRELFFSDQPTVPLDYGTEYFVAFRNTPPPSGPGGSAFVNAIEVASEDLMTALPGGKEVYGAWFNTAINPAQWVHEKTFRPQIDLILAPY
jgi:hypothetical protein